MRNFHAQYFFTKPVALNVISSNTRWGRSVRFAFLGEIRKKRGVEPRRMYGTCWVHSFSDAGPHLDPIGLVRTR
jgi:hypothetical protein